MDMPSRPDGDAVRNGLPYSRIAHLAEDIRAVEAINRGLQAQGLSAPEIHAIDTRNGLAIIEDFGAASLRSLLDDADQFPLCLTSAVMLLANMAGKKLAGSCRACFRRQLPAFALRHGRDADRGGTVPRLVLAACVRHRLD